MPITKRSTKGSDLTWAEMDANWAELEGLLTRLGLFAASQTPGANQIPVLDANGNLGIGCAPGAKVEIYQNSTAIPALRLRYSPTTSYADHLLNPNGDYEIYAPGSGVSSGDILIRAAGRIDFAVGNNNYVSPSMSMDTAGNLLVGTTASAGGRLQIDRDANAQNIWTRNTLASGWTGSSCHHVMQYSGGSPNNSQCYFIYAYDTIGARFQVFSNGNVQNANNSYGAISDAKLKTNVEPARSYLDDICNVQIRKYNLLTDPDGPKMLGVVAQELEAVFPGMVEEAPDLAERQAMNPDGTPRYEQMASDILGPDERPIMVDDPTKPIMESYQTGEVTKSVKYSVFVPMLITAIQALKENNDKLEARLAALESV